MNVLHLTAKITSFSRIFFSYPKSALNRPVKSLGLNHTEHAHQEIKGKKAPKDAETKHSCITGLAKHHQKTQHLVIFIGDKFKDHLIVKDSYKMYKKDNFLQDHVHSV